MKLTRYKKIASFSTSLRCDSCPVVIKKGVIYDDSARSLRLLQLFITNRGNVTVDEIRVRIVSYDKYGNVVPEKNGEKCQICTLAGGGCLPDQTVGENEVILLPSRNVVSCDVFVTKVVTAGHVTMHFTEADYVMKNTPRLVSVGSEEKNRKLKKILTVVLGSVAAFYLVFGIGFAVMNHVILPRADYTYIDRCLQTGSYSDAIARAEKIGDSDKREEIIGKAVDAALASESYEKALSYAAKSRFASTSSDTLIRVIEAEETAGRFEEALEWATRQNNLAMKKRVYNDAIAACCEKGEFREAVNYVILSGMTEKKSEVYSAAVRYYKERGAYSDALDYALKNENEEDIRLVYEPAIVDLVSKRDYNSAALYLGKCNLPDTAAIGASLKKEVFSKADRSFLLLNAKEIFPALSFTQVQTLLASPISIYRSAVGITNSGTAVATAESFAVTDAVSVSNGEAHTAFLLNNGTVLAFGDGTVGQCSTEKWTNVIALSCGRQHTVGVRADGTVLACGSNDYGQCGVGDWHDVIQVACGEYFTLGLCSDGTVLACGANIAGQCDVSGWDHVIAISAGSSHALALHYDGTVSSSGVKISEKCNVSDWKDIVAVAAGSTHSVGLKKDGTLVIAGGGQIGLGTVAWTDVVRIAAGEDNLLAVTADGKVYSAGTGKVPTTALTDIAV